MNYLSKVLSSGPRVFRMITLPTTSRGASRYTHYLHWGVFKFLSQFLYTIGTAFGVLTGMFPSTSFPNKYSGNMSFDAIWSLGEKVVTNKFIVPHRTP